MVDGSSRQFLRVAGILAPALAPLILIYARKRRCARNLWNLMRVWPHFPDFFVFTIEGFS